MTQNDQAAMNEQLTKLRLNGLSIDGDNRYKQDLIDAVIGAMMFGAQGANPPPAGHWLEQFYLIGREERDARAALATQPVVPVSAEAMSFEYAHISGERRTVSITREDVIEGMEDALYEKLSDQICRCEPIGETNVVECNCQDYVEEFALVAAPPAAAHGDEAVRFDYVGPKQERRTVVVYRDEIAEHMQEQLFHKLTVAVCMCDPDDSDNCRCDEYAEQFAMRAQGDDRLLFTDAIMPGGLTET